MSKKTDFATVIDDRVVDLRPLVEVDLAKDLEIPDMPSAVLIHWDVMGWLFLPVPDINGLSIEAIGFVDNARVDKTELVLRRNA